MGKGGEYRQEKSVENFESLNIAKWVWGIVKGFQVLGNDKGGGDGA